MHRTTKNELPHEETNKMACAPSEDSDQPGHLPSLIKVFTVMLVCPVNCCLVYSLGIILYFVFLFAGGGENTCNFRL